MHLSIDLIWNVINNFSAITITLAYFQGFIYAVVLVRCIGLAMLQIRQDAETRTVHRNAILWIAPHVWDAHHHARILFVVAEKLYHIYRLTMSNMYGLNNQTAHTLLFYNQRIEHGSLYQVYLLNCLSSTTFFQVGQSVFFLLLFFYFFHTKFQVCRSVEKTFLKLCTFLNNPI